MEVGTGEVDDVVAATAALAARRYELGGEVARGAAGRIVSAYDVVMRREVAIKEPVDRAGAIRVAHEVRALARLSHPSIIPIYDSGVRAGEPFFVMKLVAGRSLHAVIAERTTLAARLSLLPAVTAVAEAIAYAHSQGVIHRDIKPANVLVGPHGETIVIDWGLAHVASDGPAVADRGGTPAYMPPEQARGEPTDARADVYAIGALLYHLLAGAPPSAEVDTTAHTRIAGAEVIAAPLATRDRAIPADLVAIVDKAMARDRAQRYASAGELAADLARFQTGRLVAARRYSLGERAWRWVRAHRAIAVTVVIAAAAAAIAVVVTPTREQRARAACRATADEVRAAWSAPVRQQIAAAHPRLDLAPLDRRADAIATARVAACEAKITQDDAIGPADLQLACLDAAYREQRALAGVLADPATSSVASLDDALDSVERCDRVAQLAAVGPDPATPELRGLRDRIARVKLDAALRNRAGEVAALVADARAANHPPVLAEALWIEGAFASPVAGMPDRLLAASSTADAARDDYRRARAHITLLDARVTATPEQRAIRIARATAAVERVGDAGLRARLAHAVAALPRMQERYVVDEPVRVLWDGKWYPARVIGVLPDDRYKIHYADYDAKWDEVVPLSRIAPAGSP